MIVKIFKQILCLWLLDEVQRFIQQLALSGCRECKKNKPLDNYHDCFRIKSGQVPYEISNVHRYFGHAFSIVNDMLKIPACFSMVKRMLEIELSKERFSRDQIDQLLTHKTICQFSSTKESAEWILHKLYINHKEFGNEFDDQLSVIIRDSDNNDNSDNDDNDDKNDNDEENNDIEYYEENNQQNNNNDNSDNDDEKNNDIDEENNEHDGSNQQTDDEDSELDDYDEVEYVSIPIHSSAGAA